MASDRALATPVQHLGDEAAFRILYRRHTPRLYRVLHRLLGEPADAEDAVQESRFRAIAGLPGFRWEAEFGTWLIGIGLNVAHGLMRGRRNELPLQPDVAAPAPVSPETRIDLESALRRLPLGQRTVLLLHDVEGWTHAEIGRHLDVNPGTSKSQLFDARRALHAMLHHPAQGATMPDEFDLPPEDRAALAELAVDPIPARALEDRTVAAMIARGLLRTGADRSRRWALAAAVALLFFSGGFFVGMERGMSRREPAPGAVPTPAPAAGSAIRTVVWF